MASVDQDQRYAELLTNVEFDGWWVIAVNAGEVIEHFGDRSIACDVVALVEAQRRGDDLTEFKWRLAAWRLGAHADFLLRLGNAIQ